MKPLVSILIPAYNAETTIAETLQSALAQTWPQKEIIVVNDGSIDGTEKIALSFGPKVKVISTANRGLSAAINTGLGFCNGDYIQELDSDDLLVADKIERQLSALRPGESKRIVLSSPWAWFFYRTRGARFVSNSLCQDLSPVEWMLRKLGENLHMQNATWLVSRELVEAAGPWNTDLHYDQDGEYFARVLLASEGTRFVSGPAVFYRLSGMNRVSYIGRSQKKRDSLLVSMKLQIKYLRSLEESDRVREACVKYLQNWYSELYPVRPDILAELDVLAAGLQGKLEIPRLRRKYSWIKYVLGWGAANWAQKVLPAVKASLTREYDKTMLKLESWGLSASASYPMNLTEKE